MVKPQKPPPTPVTEHTTAKTARGLTKEELELAAGLEKVA